MNSGRSGAAEAEKKLAAELLYINKGSKAVLLCK